MFNNLVDFGMENHLSTKDDQSAEVRLADEASSKDSLLSHSAVNKHQINHAHTDAHVEIECGKTMIRRQKYIYSEASLIRTSIIRIIQLSGHMFNNYCLGTN